jgi:pimeloyl-ACP methyl ester carboxylesterase
MPRCGQSNKPRFAREQFIAEQLPVRRKWLVRLVILSAVIIAAWFLCSLAVAYRYVRRAQPIFAEPVPNITWAAVQTVQLHTEDGEQIGAWFIAGPADKPAVLFLHGNGGCRSACLGPVETLVREGYSVLTISLRAHGDSSGDTKDFGYSARYDVIAAVAWLRENRPGKSVVVWGQSFGSAAAIFAAERLGEDVGGYILECPYKDLRTAVWNRLKERLPPVLDAIAYAGLLSVSPLLISDVDRISPINEIGKTPSGVPILILAGGKDTRAPLDDARSLAIRVAGHSSLVLFDGADHLQLEQNDPAKYRTTILRFLDLIEAVDRKRTASAASAQE